jgi:hypothetical protein
MESRIEGGPIPHDHINGGVDPPQSSEPTLRETIQGLGWTLDQDPEKILPDVFSVWVRDADEQTALDHEMLFPSREWTTKAGLARALHELSTFERTTSWHQATSWMFSVMPSISANAWPIMRPRTIHASKTSRNSSRQASRVSAFAHTP